MAMMKSILITSEEKAWDALENMLKNRVAGTYVEFQGWPNFDLNIKGERYSSTLPANLLARLSDIQGALNRMYGKFAYDGGDARNLKKYEKHELELVYSVKQGSTEIKADATGMLNKLGDAMNKPSTQKVAGITVCLLALIISGAIVISKKSEDNRGIEEKKLEILKAAIEHSKDLKDASKEMQDIYRDIIVSASDAKKIKIGKQVYDEQKINELAERNKNKIAIVEFSGEYKIKSIRDYQSSYVVDVQLKKDQSFRAKIRKSDVGEAEINLIVDSITKNVLVSMDIVATQLDDGYANARVKRINM